MGLNTFLEDAIVSPVRIERNDSDIWAIRADDPDKSVPGRVWTTEVVVGLSREKPCSFSARLLVSTSEDELKIEPHTPGFVQQVAETCGLSRGSFDLSPEPLLVDSDEEIERLIEMLIDPERKLPLFVLTVSEFSDDPHRPLLDAQGLARAVLGIGYVVIVPAAHLGVDESFRQTAFRIWRGGEGLSSRV